MIFKGKSKWKEHHKLLLALEVDDFISWSDLDSAGITAIRMFAIRIPGTFKTVTHKNKFYVLRVE